MKRPAEQIGGDARTAVCNVSDPAVRELTAELAYEDVTLLVNNAGVAGPVRPLVDIEPGEGEHERTRRLRLGFSRPARPAWAGPRPAGRSSTSAQPMPTTASTAHAVNAA
ncbi:hypothetical protein [Streptomyces canus]|uniref:hypothetical protein n=1 Tax=Streptomyces canus TaxID=58343 RepID=UPI0036E17B25